MFVLEICSGDITAVITGWLQLLLEYSSGGDIMSGSSAVIQSLNERKQHRKLLTYVENRIADCSALDDCMIWTLDFTENRYY